jgi:hypothetical protein
LLLAIRPAELENTVNKAQRKLLQEQADNLSKMNEGEAVLVIGPQAVREALQHAESVVNDIAGEERDKFDNMPEGLQNSETGQKLEENADTLEYINWPTIGEAATAFTEDEAETLAGEIQEVIDELEQLL